MAPAPVLPPAEASTRRGRRTARPASEVRAARKRLAGWTLFVVSCGLVVNALVGEHGYLATLRARRDYDALEAALTRTRADNQQLRDAIRRLRTDPAALEEEARRRLNLLEPGETLVIIKDVPPAPQR
jgi:cell division protein FtsB